MKLLYFFIFLSLITFGNSVHANDKYTKNSEILFPITTSWISIEDSDALNENIFSKYKNSLRSTYISKIQNNKENKECSFFDRATEKSNISNFHLIDANGDGQKDIIYTGSAECSEGDVTIIWFSDKNSFDIYQNDILHAKLLKLNPSTTPQISFVTIGCCDDIKDEYIKGNLFNNHIDKSYKLYNELILPEYYLKKPIEFIADKDIELRYSPLIDNQYLVDKSNATGLVVFGNIQRKYMVGAKGVILAEKIIHNKKWFFILMDKESNVFITHNPIDVDAGWIISSSL